MLFLSWNCSQGILQLKGAELHFRALSVRQWGLSTSAAPFMDGVGIVQIIVGGVAKLRMGSVDLVQYHQLARSQERCLMVSIFIHVQLQGLLH